MKKLLNYSFGCYVAGILLLSCQPDLGDYVDGFGKTGPDSSNVLTDTSTLLTNTSRYAKARLFPGLVCDNSRIDTTLTLDLNYNFVSNATLRISAPPVPLFSTGLYAAAGDLVTITIPENEYNLSVQIGAWSDDLTGKEAEGPLLRDARIVARKTLAPGVNTVRNLYGGHVYLVPSKPITSPVTIKFNRVCKSPDFVLGKTTNAQWHEEIRKSCVPWLELRSKHIIYVVSREFCLNRWIDDPQALMTEWDIAVREDFFKWMGLEDHPADPIDKSPQLPIRIVFDIQPSVGYGHSGNPIVVTNDYHWFGFSTDLTWLTGSNVWGIYHEIGHNAQMGLWSWSTLGETTNNLFNHKLARRNELSGRANGWPAKQDCWTCDHGSIMDKAITFATDPAANKNFDGTDARINGPQERKAPFLQIFDFIKPFKPGVNQTANDGWDFMPYLYKQGRRALRPPTSNILKHDFVYTNLCEFTKMDWRLFFKSWGIQLSNIALSSMAGKYPLMTTEVWKYNPIKRTGGNSSIDLYTPAYWAIQSYSTEEPTGEGAPNGLITALIDGNLNTFWHTQWSAQQKEPPHEVVLDLGAVTGSPLTFSKIRMAHRQNLSTRVKNLYVEYSNDLNIWTPVPGSPFAPANVAGYISLPLGTNITARYVRLRVPTRADVVSNNQFVAMAEFGVEK